MRFVKAVNPFIVVLAVVALVAAYLLFLRPDSGQKHLTAAFPRTVSLYTGSDVRILGIKVGQVDSVTPSGTKVIVKMSYDDKYKVPAGAKAVIISPSIVGDRFVQLTPVYTNGAVMSDNASLGEDRTATPLELDEIFSSLNDLDKALGPDGANAPGTSGTGALTRLLDSTAQNFGGQGVQFNTTLQNLGKLTKTLSDNKDQLFGTADQVERFANTLAKNDDSVRRFSDSLASGAGLLADERQDLAAVLTNLSTALTEVKGFVDDNKSLLTSNITKLNQISKTLVKRRDSIKEITRVAPAALNNLALAYDGNAGTLDTRAALGEVANQLTQNPSAVLCGFVEQSPGGKQACSTITSLVKGLGLGRTAPFQHTKGAADARVVQPVDRTLLGLVGAQR